MQVNIEELAKITYLDVTAIGDRQVVLMPLWDGKEWHSWHPTSAGLFKMRPIDMLHSDYVGKEAAKDTDLWIPFVDLIWQRASWPEICPLLRAIGDDFHNMATSAAKLRHFFDVRDSLRLRAGTFAETELEYLLALTRGVFDLLQEIVANIWADRIRLLDDSAEKKRRGRRLPDTFSKMILRNKRELKSADELAHEFALPPTLAEAYVSVAPFFSSLRDMRDRVVHGGKRVQTVYSTEKGFCLSRTGFAAQLFPGWLDEHRYNENLVSLLPWVAHVILGTIDACSRVMGSLAAQIELPSELAPGYRIFVRGENSEALVDLLMVAQGQAVWWDSPKTTE